MPIKDKIKQIRLVAEACELNILIWGPGKGSPEHFEKRRKLQQELQRCFPNADVSFSEDIDLGDVLPGAGQLTIPQQELWHLAACDICIVLDTAKGAGEEIAHFVSSHMAYKLLILTHERNRRSGGFPAALRENQNQVFYTDLEYDSCNLVECVLVHVRTVALGKLFGMRV